jgi:hypothetical protein
MLYYHLMDLDQKRGNAFLGAFKRIPADVTNLNLGGNRFTVSGVELVTAFATIPATVTTLDLSFSSFSVSGVDLAKAFAAIRAGVTTLDLSFNCLRNVSGVDLAAVFAAIPATVTRLDLGANSLGNKFSANELAIAFTTMRAGVTTLKLTGNSLGNLFGVELATVFAAIPATVTLLDFSNNNLSRNKLISDLVQIIAAIPQTVRFINLKGNQLFANKSVRKRDELLDALVSYEQDGRLDLAHNGEDAFLRAFLPLASAVRQGLLPYDIVINILSKLLFQGYGLPEERAVNEYALEIFFGQEVDIQAQTGLENDNTHRELFFAWLWKRKGSLRQCNQPCVSLELTPVNAIDLPVQVQNLTDAHRSNETGVSADRQNECSKSTSLLPKVHSQPNDNLKIELVKQLNRYIDRVESHKIEEGNRKGKINYAHNFSFFEKPRAINRKANYQLAKQLRDELERGTEVATIFSNRKSIEKKRKNLMTEKQLTLPWWYRTRGINSDDLNAVIETALKQREVQIG